MNRLVYMNTLRFYEVMIGILINFMDEMSIMGCPYEPKSSVSWTTVDLVFMNLLLWSYSRTIYNFKLPLGLQLHEDNSEYICMVNFGLCQFSDWDSGTFNK